VQADLVLRVVRESDGPTIIHLVGVIDAHTLDTFEGSLREVMDDDGQDSGGLDSGGLAIVLDCNELRYVNSAGFGELIRYHDQLKSRGGRLVLARVPPKIGVILEMLGLKSLIPVATGLDEARGIASRPLEFDATARLPVTGIGTDRTDAIVSNRITNDRITNDASAPTPTAPNAGASRPAVTRLGARAEARIDTHRPDPSQVVVCAICDTRLRIAGEGEWACAACGAPFTVTREGGIAFDWSRAEADGIHLTFEVSPRTLAAFAGLIEGILVERRVPHARMRRFAREAAHVCHLLAEHACGAPESQGRAPVHALLLAGPQRLHIRLVDRGRSLADRADRVFSTQKRLFLDFRYGSTAEGINVTEFAFAYAGSGVFVA